VYEFLSLTTTDLWDKRMAHFANSGSSFRWRWLLGIIGMVLLILFVFVLLPNQFGRNQDAGHTPISSIVMPEEIVLEEIENNKEEASGTRERKRSLDVDEYLLQDEEGEAMIMDAIATSGDFFSGEESTVNDKAYTGRQETASPKKVQEQNQVDRLRALSQIANIPIQQQLTESQTESSADEKADRAYKKTLPFDERPRSERLVLEPPPAPPVLKPLANNYRLDGNIAFDDFAALGKGFTALPNDFLQQRHHTQNLNFQAASGYWANTYVPGDPLLRRLHVRLKRQPLKLPDQAAHAIWQPFDTPQHSAMGLFLHADKRAVQGQTRLLLQVGLKGSARHSGRRPAMNVGIVLDLRGSLSNQQSTLFRALLQAFIQARQSGDQFMLSVAGRAGGVLLQPEDFRHGPLSLALPHLFGDAPAPNDMLLDLPQAIAATVAQLKRTDNPNAPLGSSLLLLLTSQHLGHYALQLQEQAHQYATAGIPFSAVGIGTHISQAELEELVVLGQGHLRLLDRSNEAVTLVDKELHAVSRVVARALRLNIRLQAGVKLIGIPGSQPLNAQRSEQMRQAERSIDQRLARNLGIKRDRGADEDGVQIIIPAFYANDSHVILLDVLAEKPGLLAEVSLRYKDLVYLRNGVTHAALSLGSEDTPVGPLELNVWKNLLALQLAETLKQVGTQLSLAQTDHALALLESYQALLKHVQNQVLALQQDQELQQDQQMLQHYMQLLSQNAQQNDSQARSNLADSLQYAGFAKVLPRPEQ